MSTKSINSPACPDNHSPATIILGNLLSHLLLKKYLPLIMCLAGIKQIFISLVGCGWSSWTLYCVKKPVTRHVFSSNSPIVPTHDFNSRHCNSIGYIAWCTGRHNTNWIGTEIWILDQVDTRLISLCCVSIWAFDPAVSGVRSPGIYEKTRPFVIVVRQF